jgi:type IV pilus assembly protein PilE
MKTNSFHLKAARVMHGFTLIEVMITVVIVAILAAIAYPFYSDNIRRANRMDAQAVLLEAGQFMERRFSASNSYVGALPASLSVSPKTGVAQYGIAFAANEPTATTYIIQATPVTARQLTDACGTMTISNTGARTTSGTAGCW